jgi:competence protein ComEA
LIERAGGLRQGELPSADRRLTPNSGITVGKEGEALRVQSGEIPSFYRVTLGLPISINLESEEGLTAVPGIGKNVAKTIVEERTKRGGFKNLDELMGVPGIGPKFYAKMKPHLAL